MEELSPVFRGLVGHRLARRVMRLFAIDKVNKLYERSCEFTGVDFASHLLNDLGVNYRVGYSERLNQLPQGAFITISNHPYGGLDGIMLIELLAGIRPDYKFMVNKLLALIEAMSDHFIAVSPVTTKRPEASVNLNAIRETLSHLKAGHPVGFFPSGAVSDFILKEFRIRDRNWQESVLKLIRMAKVPIVPIRFFDKNSPFFYFLGLINWRIRLIRMPYEIFNKSRQCPRIGIGPIISVAEQDRFTDLDTFGQFLRSAVYQMPLPEEFLSRTILNQPTRQMFIG